jgi:hypothetical protein
MQIDPKYRPEIRREWPHAAQLFHRSSSSSDVSNALGIVSKAIGAAALSLGVVAGVVTWTRYYDAKISETRAQPATAPKPAPVQPKPIRHRKACGRNCPQGPGSL